MRWQGLYHTLGPTAIVHLRSGPGDPEGCFAIYSRAGRSPRVYACRQRPDLLRAMLEAAVTNLGIVLKGELCAITAEGAALAVKVS